MKIENLSMVVGELQSGKRPKGGASKDSGTIPSIGGEHLNKDGGFDLEKLKYIDEKFFRTLNKGVIKENDILIVKDGATTGKVSFVDNKFPYKKAAINEHLFSLRVDTTVADPKYVFLFLKSPQGQKQILKDFRGAAIGGISRGFVEIAKIPLPSPNNQIRIATLLSRIDALIASRKDNLCLLSEFLKSTFLEMFGDPIRNSKGWNKPELKNNFGEISTGNTPPRSNAENYSPAFIEWIKTGNIDQEHMYLTPASEFLSETGVRKARTVNKGALLVACIAGSIESIGRAAIANRKVAFNQQINAIQPNSDINPLFLYWLFRISRVYIQSFAPRGMKKIITKGNFAKITMIKPPKNLQDQFASIVEKTESLKTFYQQSLNELENLYGTLSQRAFKGELDLSRIPLEKVPEETVTDATHETADQFPEPDSYAMSDPAAREKLLRQLFDAFIAERKGHTFSMEVFWTEAEQKMLEHMDDESFPLSVGDYDKAKEWLFELIKSENIRQLFYEENNYMGLSIKR